MEFRPWKLMLTSTGMISPGKTKTESPTRISSVGTSTHIASEQSTLLAEEDPLSEEVITSLDWVDISDCTNGQNKQVLITQSAIKYRCLI